MCFLNTHALTKTKQSKIIKGLLMIIHMLYHASVLHANIPELIGCILQQGREIPDFSSLRVKIIRILLQLIKNGQKNSPIFCCHKVTWLCDQRHDATVIKKNSL